MLDICIRRLEQAGYLQLLAMENVRRATTPASKLIQVSRHTRWNRQKARSRVDRCWSLDDICLISRISVDFKKFVSITGWMQYYASARAFIRRVTITRKPLYKQLETVSAQMAGRGVTVQRARPTVTPRPARSQIETLAPFLAVRV